MSPEKAANCLFKGSSGHTGSGTAGDPVRSHGLQRGLRQICGPTAEVLLCDQSGPFQPPTSATRASACGGPHVPGSYSYNVPTDLMTGSTIDHAASTRS